MQFKNWLKLQEAQDQNIEQESHAFQQEMESLGNRLGIQVEFSDPSYLSGGHGDHTNVSRVGRVLWMYIIGEQETDLREKLPEILPQIQQTMKKHNMVPVPKSWENAVLQHQTDIGGYGEYGQGADEYKKLFQQHAGWNVPVNQWVEEDDRSPGKFYTLHINHASGNYAGYTGASD